MYVVSKYRDRRIEDAAQTGSHKIMSTIDTTTDSIDTHPILAYLDRLVLSGAHIATLVPDAEVAAQIHAVCANAIAAAQEAMAGPDGSLEALEPEADDLSRWLAQIATHYGLRDATIAAHTAAMAAAQACMGCPDIDTYLAAAQAAADAAQAFMWSAQWCVGLLSYDRILVSNLCDHLSRRTICAYKSDFGLAPEKANLLTDDRAAARQARQDYQSALTTCGLGEHLVRKLYTDIGVGWSADGKRWAAHGKIGYLRAA